jgi:hypothetical protein
MRHGDDARHRSGSARTRLLSPRSQARYGIAAEHLLPARRRSYFFLRNAEPGGIVGLWSGCGPGAWSTGNSINAVSTPRYTKVNPDPAPMVTPLIPKAASWSKTIWHGMSDKFENRMIWSSLVIGGFAVAKNALSSNVMIICFISSRYLLFVWSCLSGPICLVV